MMCLPWKHRWGLICITEWGNNFYATRMCKECFKIKKRKIGSNVTYDDIENLLEEDDVKETEDYKELDRE